MAFDSLMIASMTIAIGTAVDILVYGYETLKSGWCVAVAPVTPSGVSMGVVS